MEQKKKIPQNNLATLIKHKRQLPHNYFISHKFDNWLFNFNYIVFTHIYLMYMLNCSWYALLETVFFKETSPINKAPRWMLYLNPVQQLYH